MSIKKKFEANITLTWTEDPESIEYKWDDKLITSEINTWLKDLGFKVEVKVKEYTDKKKIEKEWRDAVADGHIVSSLEEFIEDKEAGCYDKSS